MRHTRRVTRVSTALSAVIRQHSALVGGPSELLFAALSAGGTVVVLAWMAQRSADPAVSTTVALGAFLFVVWRASGFRLGILVAEAHLSGVLEREVASGTHVAIIAIGKLVPCVALYAIVGMAASATVAATSGRIFVAAPMLAGLAFVGSLVAVAALVLLLAALGLLFGGYRGIFTPIVALGAVLSGFLQPVHVLPTWLESIARLLPTSWAMEALWMSVTGAAGAREILVHLAICGIVALGYVAAGMVVFTLAERRLRSNGFRFV